MPAASQGKLTISTTLGEKYRPSPPSTRVLPSGPPGMAARVA
jgi:hypothetical protein